MANAGGVWRRRFDTEMWYLQFLWGFGGECNGFEDFLLENLAVLDSGLQAFEDILASTNGRISRWVVV